MTETILITGAGGGIGIEVPRALDAPGRHLVCLDALPAALERIAGLGFTERITCRQTDLADAATARAAVASAGGPVHGLVHLAGVFEPDPEGVDAMGVYDRAIAHNLTSGYVICGAKSGHVAAQESATPGYGRAGATRGRPVGSARQGAGG